MIGTIDVAHGANDDALVSRLAPRFPGRRMGISATYGMLAIATDAPFPVPGNTRYRALDAVLLALLSGGALDAPRFFTTLFAGADPGALARFMSDASTPIDDARVLGGWLRHTA